MFVVNKVVSRRASQLQPYVVGLNPDNRQFLKLGSNEHPLGPSPEVITAMADALVSAHRYMSARGGALLDDLARLYGLAPDSIILGNGSDNCLLVIAQTFLDEGDRAIVPWPTFPMYKTVIQAAGGVPILVDMPITGFDLERVLAAVDNRTKLVFVCNPNNPTGTMVTRTDLIRFLQALPDHVIVVLDEAYAEFVTDETYSPAHSLIKDYPQVVGVRTFSKIYGLAGMRLGHITAAPDVASWIGRLQEPFSVNNAVYAGARAALADSEYRQQTRELVASAREVLYAGLAELGIQFIPSTTNFVLINLDRPSKPVFEELLARQIIVRPGATWNLDTYLRISLGTPEQMKLVVTELAKIID